jgi:arylsulfatase A-like enzyme
MSTTLPSHTSLFTGVLPDEHGILANALFTGERFVPSESLIPLPIFLQSHGWLTAGFVGATPLKKHSGFSRGFSAWSEPESTMRKGEVTVKTALGWLEKAPPEQPVMMFVHFFDPHHPYQPSGDLRDAFEATDEDVRRLREAGVKKATGDDAKIVEQVDRYDEEILYTDRQTARLIAGWKERRDWSRTVVVIVADHGEGLMQHNTQQHGLTWNEQLHAPLLIRVPGQPGRRVPQLLGGNDVLPTLLGLIDLPEEEKLSGQVTGSDTLAPGFVPRPVVSRTSVRQISTGAASSWSLTDVRYKIIVRPKGDAMLFDLQNDPHELNDIAKSEPALTATMVAQLKERVAASREHATKIGAGKTEKLDQSTMDQLGELGYLE